MPIPVAKTCCHCNAIIRPLDDRIHLIEGHTLTRRLLWAHGANNVAELFAAVESAPELSPESPVDDIYMDTRLLSTPLVYGVPASEWDN